MIKLNQYNISKDKNILSSTAQRIAYSNLNSLCTFEYKTPTTSSNIRTFVMMAYEINNNNYIREKPYS